MFQIDLEREKDKKDKTGRAMMQKMVSKTFYTFSYPFPLNHFLSMFVLA